MTDWRTNLPSGTRPGDEDRREAEDDRDFWDALWDHAHRFAEENERDERFRERLERIENYERTSIATD